MKSIDMKTLESGNYYILYERTPTGKVLLLINPIGEFIDTHNESEYFRYTMGGKCLFEYLLSYREDFDNIITLDVIEADDYDDGFEFREKDPALFWKLTDEEVAIHTIGHL